MPGTQNINFSGSWRHSVTQPDLGFRFAPVFLGPSIVSGIRMFKVKLVSSDPDFFLKLRLVRKEEKD
jgi:hypothetical protein